MSDAQLSEQIARIKEGDAEAGTDVADRMRRYFDARKEWNVAEDEHLRVFVLSTKPIVLVHEPRPKRNNTFKKKSWTLADFLDTSTSILP